jgi:hypothetical protein
MPDDLQDIAFGDERETQRPLPKGEAIYARLSKICWILLISA